MLPCSCRFDGIENTNQYEELIKVFLQPSEYTIVQDAPADFVYTFTGDKDLVKRQLYRDLSDRTGKSPKWGILTGIRPVKLAGELLRSLGTMDRVRETLRREYLLHQEKADLVTEILQYQREELGEPEENSLSLYAGIPFCPTRCLYCSFPSNQVRPEEYGRYLEALLQEIRWCGRAAAEEGFRVESVYIGGGTPTSLDAGQLTKLLGEIGGSFDLASCREFTVEAGRPDTFTRDRLEALRDHGADRISINPQTMKPATLELIGRQHTAEQTLEAFDLARRTGNWIINTDLIAGLPQETEEDFARSLETILQAGADNITLHTLAVKRASRLKELDENFNYRQEELRERMLRHAGIRLREEGYRPYYLYRQKHTSGNTENIGYCRPGTANVYNVRIMEEAQSILAMGAGGISKIYFPRENRLERVANVTNYEIYIDRISEMIERKKRGFFGVRGIGGDEC